jgi:hypothetical protein
MTIEDAHHYLLDLCRRCLPDQYQACPLALTINLYDPVYRRDSDWKIEASILMRFRDRRPGIYLGRLEAYGETVGAALLVLCSRADKELPENIKGWASEDFWYRDPMR